MLLLYPTNLKCLNYTSPQFSATLIVIMGSCSIYLDVTPTSITQEAVTAFQCVYFSLSTCNNVFEVHEQCTKLNIRKFWLFLFCAGSFLQVALLENKVYVVWFPFRSLFFASCCYAIVFGISYLQFQIFFSTRQNNLCYFKISVSLLNGVVKMCCICDFKFAFIIKFSSCTSRKNLVILETMVSTVSLLNVVVKNCFVLVIESFHLSITCFLHVRKKYYRILNSM